MSILQRQLLWGIFLSFFVFVSVLLTVFFAYPVFQLSDLWKTSVFGMPFVLFSFSLSLTIGSVIGGIMGFMWRQQWTYVENRLYEIENGQRHMSANESLIQETSRIISRLNKVDHKMILQAQQSQKMATEKVENQQKQVQEIVSQERNRLARELHDSVSQQLFAASMLMSAITESNLTLQDSEAKQLKMVEKMINQSQLEMRALLLHLRPAALKGKSLQAGMKELMNELAQKVPLELNWKIEGFELDKGIEDHLFRILQESVSNTLRHANATALDVLLIKRDFSIILRIVDNGVGFDVEKEKVGSYGLQNMYERAVEIGGLLKIISLPDKGTKLEVKVPLVEREEKQND
ncbi:sensor histidine kinase [Priestia aryabhattai]|uniref:Sensor histidine kinase n=2 Tax=Priestia TaxID=2800373 RepID=A0AAX6N2X9_PRIAR|nr:MULTISPECIES: sensor histidine kinase [Priestia]AEN90675.1 Histidine kinase, putative [Priestia megaterium WSH-002]MDU9689845.1 sensor histidine kinase [Priestia aryabhattai]QDZ81409.1 sensor histidine kinase [Priestia megaterium]TPF18121.1 two-component sensor histidine kinase [Priestia megaterium]TPF22228.1 two-component sensor histidine kinase [Priestia megaterium]